MNGFNGVIRRHLGRHLGELPLYADEVVEVFLELETMISHAFFFFHFHFRKNFRLKGNFVRDENLNLNPGVIPTLFVLLVLFGYLQFIK